MSRAPDSGIAGPLLSMMERFAGTKDREALHYFYSEGLHGFSL